MKAKKNAASTLLFTCSMPAQSVLSAFVIATLLQTGCRVCCDVSGVA